jgi:hypothetical protein
MNNLPSVVSLYKVNKPGSLMQFLVLLSMVAVLFLSASAGAAAAADAGAGFFFLLISKLFANKDTLIEAVTTTAVVIYKLGFFIQFGRGAIYNNYNAFLLSVRYRTLPYKSNCLSVEITEMFLRKD